MEWHHDGLITRRSVVRIGLPQQRRGPQGPRSSFEGPLVTAPPAEVDRCVAYKDPERQKAYALEWLKRYPEKARAAAKKWNHANPEKRREQKRRQYARDPAKAKAERAAWHDAHPDVKRTSSVRYRARKFAAEGSFTTNEWTALVRANRGRCAYCGVRAPLQADHRTPLSRGGSNFIANILPACQSCNCRKARTTEREFRVRLANERLRSSEFEVVDWWAAGQIESVS